MTEAELAAMLSEVQETAQNTLDKAGDDFFPVPGTYIVLLGVENYVTYTARKGPNKGSKAGFLPITHEFVSGPDQPNGEKAFKFSLFSSNPVHARYLNELVAVVTGEAVPQDYTSLVMAATDNVSGKVVQMDCFQKASEDGTTVYNNIKYTGLAKD